MYIPETLIRLSVFYFFEEHMELGGGMLRGSYMESWRQEVEAGMIKKKNIVYIYQILKK